MKILFFGSVTCTLERNFEAQMELILKHLNRGDEVVYVCMDNELFKVQTFQDPPELVYKARVIFEDFKLKIRELSNNILFEEYLNLKDEIDIPLFEDIEELKKYQYDGFGVGMACASTLISGYRDHGFDTQKPSNSFIVEKMLLSAIKVLTTIRAYHKKYTPDLVYIFNGRGVPNAPIALYCKKNKILFKSYELVNSPNRYDLIENTIPHDISYRAKQISDMWQDNSVPQIKKIEIAKQFFESNRKGNPIAGENFTYLQKTTNISLNKYKEIITFFNSSIDEYASVPGWEKYIFLFENEVDAIKTICNSFKNDKEKLFVLRIHPNLIGLDNLQTKNLKKLNGVENLVIFPPESSISSYQLIDISSKVVTFGSTIGIEACYFKKPSISLGLSFYIDLDVCYIPKDKEELLKLIKTPNLKAKPKENTYPYGYWVVSFGIPFELRGRDFPRNYFSLSKIQKIRYFGIKLFSRNFIKEMMSSAHRKRLFKRLKSKISRNG